MALFERQTDGGFIVALPFENAFPLLVQEIQKLGWGVHMVDPTTGHIQATTGMSMLTFGETIWISAFSIPQGTSVAMRVEATGFAPAFQGSRTVRTSRSFAIVFRSSPRPSTLNNCCFHSLNSETRFYFVGRPFVAVPLLCLICIKDS